MNRPFILSTAEEAYEKLLSLLPLTCETVGRTPSRAAKALSELTSGYHKTVKSVVGEGVFPYAGDGVVHINNIEVASLCEHHLLPFFGTCAISYIPNGSVLGLSKPKRIVDVFAKRLQMQERLTDQVAEAISEVVNAKGVLVVMKCTHLCMKIRGVKDKDSQTMTVAARGEFITNLPLRKQYLSTIENHPKI
jgi:GTP cyclohydrolase IA